jgi:hypothetical protein
LDKKVGVGGLARKTESKRGRSKWDVERRRRHIVLVIISLTIVSALAIIGYGYYATRIKPWHQPIVRVNDTVLDMDYFVKMLRLWGVGQDPYSDVESAQSIAVTMISNELMRRGAEEQFGIVVSEEAVNGKIREIFGSEMTDEEFEQKYKEVIASLAESGLSEGDFKRKYVESEVIRTELLNRFGEAKYPVDEVFPHVHIQAILVVGSDNATAVRERWSEGIEQLAEAFSASSYYPTTDNVEWVSMGLESSALDDYVFGEGSKEENLGRISDPIEDSEQSGSFWVIQVLGKEGRPLSDDHRDVLIGKAFNEWLDNEKKPEVNEVINYLESEAGYGKISWALENV